MSKDIRSFFQILSKKQGDQHKQEKKQKKVIILIESDDEDVINCTPEKPRQTKRRAQVLSSDSEDDNKSKKNRSPSGSHNRITQNHKKATEKTKFRAVNLDILNKPIKQSIVENPPKVESSKNEVKSSHKDKEINKKATRKNRSKKNTELGVHGDKDFEKTLQDLDEDSDDTILLDNLDILDRTIEEAAVPKNLNDEKVDSSKIVEKVEKRLTTDKKHGEAKRETLNTMETQITSECKDSQYKNDCKRKHKKEQEQEKVMDQMKGKQVHGNEQEHENGEKLLNKEKRNEPHQEKTSEKNMLKKAEKRPRKNSESTPTPKKKQKLEHVDSGIVQDQETWEKKRYSAGLYQAYLHRPGPKHHGQKVYPKGKPECLSDLTFLRTGVLDSLEGEEFQSLVSDHGGRVVHSVTKKVNYIVVGDEPGPAKMEKAKKYGIPEISEDQFLDMILVKSEMKPKYAVNTSSEDFGFEESEFGSEDIMDKISPKIEKCNEKQEVDHDESLKTEYSQEQEKTVEKETEKKTEDKCLNLKETTIESRKDDSSVLSSNVKTGFGPTSILSWTEKYKPSKMKDVIGQQEANSNMNKLKKWLQDWFKNQNHERRKQMKKPGPYNCGGEYYKAALLSGPPGVGKTTTATLVAKELGFDIVEFNASDTRNKKLLHEEISQMMNSKTVAGFASGEKNVNKKRVLLMDEVDGMAGNEDRGGIAELISFIKTANFPIICMCNNREHQKMRTLVNYCYGLKFGPPTVQQVRGAMLSVCFKEGIKIKPDALARLIIGTGCDIRQTLNHLAMWSVAEKDISSECVQKESKNSQKDVVKGPWDVIRKVFTKSENVDMTLSDKSRLFFYDYSLGPLFVQENYIRVMPDCTESQNSGEALIRYYLTADSLSTSDLIDSKIRRTNNWSLLESQAFYSTVLPSYYLSGKIDRSISFPTWFGMHSKRNKKLRIVSELYSHSRMRISGDKNSMLMDYVEYLKDLLIKPLKTKGSDGVKDTFEVMTSYSLLRDDVLNLCDLLHRFGRPNIYESIDSNIKTALTRLCTKKLVLSFAPPVVSKKKKNRENDELAIEEEEYSDEEETEDKITDDTLIKVKTKVSAKPSSSRSSGTKQESRKGTKTNEGKNMKGKGKK